MSNYKLELLRHNATETQALRAVHVPSAKANRKSKLYRYELVRRTNLCEPVMHQERSTLAEDGPTTHVHDRAVVRVHY